MAVTWSWYVNRNRQAPATRDAAAEPPKLDGALEKLVKLFPVEVVTVYTGADQFARTASGDMRTVLLAVVALAGLVLVPGAFTRLRRVSWRDRAGLTQILIGCAAFLVWVYAQGALATALGVYNAPAAGVLVFLFLGVVWIYGPSPE